MTEEELREGGYWRIRLFTIYLRDAHQHLGDAYEGTSQTILEP